MESLRTASPRDLTAGDVSTFATGQFRGCQRSTRWPALAASMCRFDIEVGSEADATSGLIHPHYGTAEHLGRGSHRVRRLGRGRVVVTPQGLSRRSLVILRPRLRWLAHVGWTSSRVMVLVSSN